MAPPRFIARQLAHPAGSLGRIVGWLMNRHNARMNVFAARRLELSASDRVLEIGFGGGAALPLLIGHAAFVAGLDRSEDAVARATARYRAAVASRRAEFRRGDAAALPYDTASFDKAATVNTIYFWPSLEAGFAEIHRVLRSRGRVVVGFLPKARMDRMGMPADIFTTRAPEDVIAALRRTGFTRTAAERPTPETAWTVVVAER